MLAESRSNRATSPTKVATGGRGLSVGKPIVDGAPRNLLNTIIDQAGRIDSTQPFPLPRCVISILNWQSDAPFMNSLDTTRITIAKLLKQNRQRPTVRNDVVNLDKQHMVFAGQPEKDR